MSLGLHGTIPERGCEGVGCVGCPFNVRDVDNWDGCRSKRGWSAAWHGVALWGLFDPDEGAALAQLLRAAADGPQDVDGCVVIPRATCAALASTLRALIRRMEARWGPMFAVPADEAEAVAAVVGDRLDCWDLPDGRRCSLWNRVGEILDAAIVLEGAVRLGRDAELD